jgi:hypothetical protein
MTAEGFFNRLDLLTSEEGAARFFTSESPDAYRASLSPPYTSSPAPRSLPIDSLTVTSAAKGPRASRPLHIDAEWYHEPELPGTPRPDLHQHGFLPSVTHSRGSSGRKQRTYSLSKS